MNELRKDAEEILSYAIREVLPEEAVKRTLKDHPHPKGKLILVSVGKAAWSMAHAALECVTPDKGIVITKEGHLKGPLGLLELYEAGHPLVDERSLEATKQALTMIERSNEDDEVLFLLSGGASALFEYPKVSLEELRDVNGQLLRCGADIREINTIRKRLSYVKGGRFALHCAPARVTSIILSDVLGDPLDMIGSGPTAADSSTCEDAVKIAEKYSLTLSEKAMEFLKEETPKDIPSSSFVLAGNLHGLLTAAKKRCEELGYEAQILEEEITGEAREEGRRLALEALKAYEKGRRGLALIKGGETVVYVHGTGLGGRNQEFALSAAQILEGKDIAVFSAGSDGTDGPTDAAGGYVDGDTMALFREKGIDPEEVLKDNDAYHALQECGGLLITGPTGTNVNDLSVALIGKKGLH